MFFFLSFQIISTSLNPMLLCVTFYFFQFSKLEIERLASDLNLYSNIIEAFAALNFSLNTDFAEFCVLVYMFGFTNHKLYSNFLHGFILINFNLS